MDEMKQAVPVTAEAKYTEEQLIQQLLSYCYHCDGWQLDCEHGRYTGPYEDWAQ